MSVFQRNFIKVLREADNADLEQQSMNAVLDDGTNPDDFNADMSNDINQDIDQASKMASDAMSKKNAKIVAELDGWISQIDSFLKFLNDTSDPNSIQSRLAMAQPDTVMDKMKQSQQTNISRVASDLGSLHQKFLGFKGQTTNARFRYV